MNKKNGVLWKDIEKEILTKEEIEEAELEAEYICMLADLRDKHKITQKQLEQLSGIKQPMIARIENGDTMPRVNTLMKLLRPMGLTLKIVPIKNAKD